MKRNLLILVTAVMLSTMVLSACAPATDAASAASMSAPMIPLQYGADMVNGNVPVTVMTLNRQAWAIISDELVNGVHVVIQYSSTGKSLLPETATDIDAFVRDAMYKGWRLSSVDALPGSFRNAFKKALEAAAASEAGNALAAGWAALFEAMSGIVIPLTTFPILIIPITPEMIPDYYGETSS